MKSSCFQNHSTIQHNTPWWSDWMWTVEVGQGQSWGFRDWHRTCGQSCFEPYADFEGCMALLHFKCSPSWVTAYIETCMKRLQCHWKRVLPTGEKDCWQTLELLVMKRHRGWHQGLLTTLILTLQGSRRHWRLDERISHQAEVTVTFFNAACEPESNFGQLKGGQSP